MKTTKNLSQDNQSPGWNLNLESPEHESGALPLLHPGRSFYFCHFTPYTVFPK
jgi:hypothetical protein